VAHRDAEMELLFRTLRERHRVGADEANSVAHAAAGKAQLISRIAPESLREYARSEAAYEMLARLGPRSHIAVPLDVLGQPGALLLGISHPEREPYGEQELAMAEEIAQRVGSLLTRARAREEEHSVATRLQQVLLPEELLRHPAVAVAAHYETGSKLLRVGGDWYDSFILPDGRLALSVGDVVGHGLESAAAMGRLRIALAALALHADGPADLLSRLEAFCAGGNGVDFATTCYAVVDPESGVVTYASAGHPPMMIVSPSGETRLLEEGRSAPVGSVVGRCARFEASTTLSPGDLLIAYSDGLIERRREPITTGLQRMEDVAQSLRSLPVDEVCRRLVAELTADGPDEDDVVVLCFRFSPVTERRFHRVLPSHAGELSLARAALREWLNGRLERSAMDDFLIAVGEALTNAVEHAYDGDEPGMVTLMIEDDAEGRLHVEVADRGRWRTETPNSDRGRGTSIMAAFSDDFSRMTTAEGTTVTFTFSPSRVTA
jgi:serine phosphatase RsbU (regulator of sigma subunit)/anti-sigma regulatory factor (Ser/Thr protein kinase)